MKREVCTATEEEEERRWASLPRRQLLLLRLIHAKDDFLLQPKKCQVPVCARRRRFTPWLNMSARPGGTRAEPRADPLPGGLWARHLTSTLLLIYTRCQRLNVTDSHLAQINTSTINTSSSSLSEFYTWEISSDIQSDSKPSCFLLNNISQIKIWKVVDQLTMMPTCIKITLI